MTIRRCNKKEGKKRMKIDDEVNDEIEEVEEMMKLTKLTKWSPGDRSGRETEVDILARGPPEESHHEIDDEEVDEITKGERKEFRRLVIGIAESSMGEKGRKKKRTCDWWSPSRQRARRAKKEDLLLVNAESPTGENWRKMKMVDDNEAVSCCPHEVVTCYPHEAVTWCPHENDKTRAPGRENWWWSGRARRGLQEKRWSWRAHPGTPGREYEEDKLGSDMMPTW
jgi:hypothetical protein